MKHPMIVRAVSFTLTLSILPLLAASVGCDLRIIYIPLEDWSSVFSPAAEILDGRWPSAFRPLLGTASARKSYLSKIFPPPI